MIALSAVQPLERQWRPAPNDRSGPALVAGSSWPTAAEVQGRRQPEPGVPNEQLWCKCPAPSASDALDRIFVSRWKEESSETRRHEAPAGGDFAIVAIAARATDARINVDGKCLHDGKMAPGTAMMTAAGLPATAEFRAPCDMLHLFVPRERLDNIMRELDGAAGNEAIPPTILLAEDLVIERLAWLLLNAREYEAGSAGHYIHAIAVAIVSRLLSLNRQSEAGSALSPGLVKWRLRRVEALIEEKLSETLSLGDLASCAGLSRMHFAAQFREATGMRPHEYLVRQRIRRAQEMLVATTVPLVEVALSVGFQTQAHFTTVFRKLLGETPGRWRQMHRFG